MPYTKPALSHAEQLQQLKNRGLIILNEPKALFLLESISYYRLSGYWFPFLETPKTGHVFKRGATFEAAFKLSSLTPRWSAPDGILTCKYWRSLLSRMVAFT